MILFAKLLLLCNGAARRWRKDSEVDGTKKIYDAFLKKTREIFTLQSIGAVLHWDKETFMPKKGVEGRANQLQLLSGLNHDALTDPALGEAIEQLSLPENWKNLSQTERVNVREMKRSREQTVKLPKKLSQEMSLTNTMATEAWIEARRQNRFQDVIPWLEKVVALQRQYARCMGFQNDYDALLDRYEPQMTADVLNPLFEKLRKALVPLVPWAQEKTALAKPVRFRKKFPILTQTTLEKCLLEKIGFDLDCGRLDISTHPFCISFSGDVRITTRYQEENFCDSLMSVLHEAGHGLYEQGFLPEHRDTPMAEGASFGIHESQSRFWENIVGRSRFFWRYFTPIAKKHFPGILEGISAEDLFHQVNQVRPSFIRVNADELTYNLHILLRFEIEQEMVNSGLKIADLPEIWNARMKNYLGIIPPEDRLGVLQDVHWYSGSIGYFATYTLGNLYAAQWCRQMQKEIPDMEEQIERGEFLNILGWLRKNIHSKGQFHPAGELCGAVTKEPLNEGHFLNYLKRKYETIDA